MADSYVGYAPADRLYLANASVDNAALATSAITGQTALGAAPAAADVLLVYDDSASALKKVTYANFGGDIAGVTAGTGLNGGGTSGTVTLNLDATLTGMTSITSTAFVGALTGNVTGNASGTAATVTGAAQTAITSVAATGLGINKASPTALLDILAGTGSEVGINIKSSGAAGNTARLTSNAGDDGQLELLQSTGTSIVKIVGDASTNSYINSQYLGIGTTGPDKLLHLVGGDLKLEGTSAQKELIFKRSDATAPHGKISYLDSAGTQYWTIGSNLRAGPGWEINEGAGQGTCRFNVAVGGNVGIGLDTTAPVKQFEISKSAVARISALSDAATIAVDFNTAQNWSVTLAGNRTLANPTNITAGQTGSIFVTQDGTGGRTLSFASYWDFVAGTAPTMTTTAAAVDRIDYIVRTTTSIEAVVTLAYS